MPVSTLNKVISLLVVGSLAMAALLVACWPRASAFLQANLEANAKLVGTTGVGLIGFLVFTESALFLGVLIDGAAELSVRPAVNRAVRSRCASRFFRLRRTFERTEKWETQMLDLAVGRHLCSGWGEFDERARQIATAIFFARASKDHLDWVASHHSTYHLATGFVVIVPFLCAAIFVGIIVPNGGSWAHITVYALLCLVAALVVCYLLLVLAVERYLYTFGATSRFAVLCLDKAFQSSLPPSTP
jgi:hypothetical protein